MSFTLMRHKDGKATPIKLSIWDAFKGAPPPKRRLHECPQCGTIHLPGTKHDSKVALVKSATKGKDKKATDSVDTATKSEDEHNFSAEEDAKLLEMKAGDATWAKIIEALGNGRTKGMLAHRYKQLKATETKSAGNDKRQEKKEEKPFEQMTKVEKKAYKARIAKEEGLKKQEAEVKEKEGASEPATTQETTTSSRTKSDRPVTGEKQKWIAAASKHFDKTGQRITPEQARSLAEKASKK